MCDRQTLRRAVGMLRDARGDLETLATDGRLAALPMHNGASALDWAGTALCNVRAALALIDRGEPAERPAYSIVEHAGEDNETVVARDLSWEQAVAHMRRYGHSEVERLRADIMRQLPDGSLSTEV